MKKHLLYTLLLVVYSNLPAQNNNKIECVALVKKDSVVLRWVPVSIPVWQVGVKYGYIIERYTIAKGGQFIPDGLRNGRLLTPEPIKPMSNEAFENLAKTDSRAAVVQEAIYGEDFQPLVPGNNFQGFMKSYNDLDVRFGFALFMCDLSPEIARAAGLRFTDKDVLPDERYAYSISLVNIPDGMTLQPAVVALDAGSPTKLPQVTDVQAIFLDKTVKFHWPVMIHKGVYTAYILEKCTDGIHYKPVSDLPLVNASEKENPDYFVYTDSLQRNDEQTWYRVKGLTPFGEEGPAGKPVKGHGKPGFPAYAVIDTAEISANNQVVIHWRVTETKDAPVKGIVLSRASNPGEVYMPLTSKPLSSDTRTFTDTRPGISNYYKITLLGDNNLQSQSFPYLVQTEDNDPPSPPQMLSGKVDLTGQVTITWKANTEPDIKGYRLFRANVPHEEFINLGSDITTENYFNDTINLNTLTQKIYYKAVAVDKHYNNSEYSAMLELSRPDTIRPAPAVITSLEVKNGKVLFRLENSPSTDISLYELFCNTENDPVPQKITSWEGSLPAMYEDVPPVGGTSYVYILKTFDMSGNCSVYSRMAFVPAATQKTITLKAVQGKNGKSILLTWNIPASFQPVKTIIYRGKASGPMSVYAALESSAQSYEDTDIEINTSYLYRLKITGTNGQTLISGNPINIKPMLK